MIQSALFSVMLSQLLFKEPLADMFLWSTSIGVTDKNVMGQNLRTQLRSSFNLPFLVNFYSISLCLRISLLGNIPRNYLQIQIGEFNRTVSSVMISALYLPPTTVIQLPLWFLCPKRLGATSYRQHVSIHFVSPSSKNDVTLNRHWMN